MTENPTDPNRRPSDDLLGRSFTQRSYTSATKTEGTGAAMRSFVRVLRRRLPILLICSLLVPAAALFWSVEQPEEYESSASLLFRNVELNSREGGSTFSNPSDDPTRAAETNLRLVESGVIAARTALRLDEEVTPAMVTSAIEVSLEGQSDIANITAKTEDPELSARMANTFAKEYIEQRREADRRTILVGKSRIEAELAQLSPEQAEGIEGEALARQIEELSVQASLQTGNAEIVQLATPNSSPVSPKPLRNTILGLIFGLLLGVGLILLLEQFDTRIKDEEGIEDAYGLPILASVPHTKKVVKPHEMDVVGLGPPGAEALRMLHANLRYFNVDRKVESLLLTSASPQEGKTTVSWGLSVTEARSGKSVLLIEADMRQPSLAKRLERTPESGLSLVLAGEDTLEEAVVSTGIGHDADSELDVLFSGPTPPNSAELLESPRMKELLREAKERYDMVVIDAPPVIVADAIPLMTEASGVLVVARLNHAKFDLARNLRELLAHLGATPLGTVANDTAPRSSGYYMPYVAGRAELSA
ncbi:MAG TPA: polysaccharide biosynthesis tyrosine autokinase [Solirubrobacterales bacterium]|nr:polysaccharide biosynthesis tyrosine autokinase [Solirubrobacterales bacterium]